MACARVHKAPAWRGTEFIDVNRFLVLLTRKPGFDSSLIGAHRDFLAQLQARARLQTSGPFADGSGGAYVLDAGSFDEALAIAHSDPLHVLGASVVVVREWVCA